MGYYIYVTTREGTRLYHKKGRLDLYMWSEFTSLKSALRVARKRYRPLLGNQLQSWTIQEI